MDLNYAIFDLDGTLIDSMGYWGEVCRDLLEQYGIEEDLLYLATETAVMTDAESAAWLRQTYRLPVSEKTILESLREAFHRCYLEAVPAKDGAADYLKKLQTRGANLCVASASPISEVREILERLDLLRYFSFVISCEEAGAGKTSPAVYLEAAKRFGVSPGEIAVFEDSLLPLRTAKAAGFYTVAVFDRYAGETWKEARAIASETVPDWNKAE